MTIDEQIAHLNALSEPNAEETCALSQEEVRELLRNPPKRKRVISPESIDAIVEAFRDGDADARRHIASALTKHAKRGFLSYAGNAAVLAVRQNSTDLIRRGLVALVIENGGDDWRDNLFVMFTLYHSANKLGMGADTFAEIAKIAEPGVIKKEMNDFPLRPPESRSLAAFRLEEEISPEGFRYKQIPWRPQARSAAELPVETKEQG